MKELIREVKSCLSSENYYAAVTLCLTLPDVAGKVEFPGTPSGERYKLWFDKYVKIQRESTESEDKPMLTGKDCWALRNAVLHESNFVMDETKKTEHVKSYQFLTSRKTPREKLSVGDLAGASVTIRDPKSDSELVVFVSYFCDGMTNGANEWLDEIQDDEIKQAKLKEFAFID